MRASRSMIPEHADRVAWSETDVRAFLCGYGIVPGRMVVERLDSWWWNLVLRVEVDQRAIILRRYGVTPREEVLWEVELLQHLRAHDFPCVTPLVGPGGEAAEDFLGKPAIVYPYIDGDDYSHLGLTRSHAVA